MLAFISPLQVAQHVSGNHVPIFRSWRLRSVIATCWYCAVTMNGVIVTAQYQHVAITLRSCQLLKMGTWLPETCWGTCKGEIKDDTKVTSSWFLIHTKLCSIWAKDNKIIHTKKPRWRRDFPTVQTGPETHPTSCKMGTWSFSRVKCGRGVLLTTHPLLVLRSWKSRAIPLPTFWATPGL